MSQLKRLAGDTAIYGVSSILGRMLNYLLVPYYTRVFIPDEYGVIVELYASAAFFNVLYLYGMETAYFRFASSGNSDPKTVYSSAFTSILLSSIILSGSLIFWSQTIAEALQYPDKPTYIIWFALIFFIDAITALPFAKLRLENKAIFFAIAKIINIVFTIALNLFFITFCSWVYDGNGWGFFKPLVNAVYNPNLGVEYVFISNLIANALLLIILYRELIIAKITIHWHTLKPMLKYAYPLLFTGLAYATNEMLSRWALKYWLPEGFYPGQSNMAALGVFGAVYKLSIFMTLGIQAFRYAAEPFFFSQSSQKDSPELFSKVMHWFVILGCLVFLGVSINLDILQHILRNPAYREGIHVVPVLLMANLFLGIYYNLSVWYKVTDNTHYGTWITITGAILTIVLNYLLIPRFGYEGSAFVTLITYVIMTGISYYYGKKLYPIPYSTGRDMTYIVITWLVTYLVLQIDFQSQIIATTFHGLVVITFIYIIYRIEKPHFLFKKN